MKSLMKSSLPSSSRMMSRVSVHERRGNTIVLVTGILVLLVIIATAYVSRTGAGRVSSTGVNNAGLRLDVQHVVADMLADEVAAALFMRQIDGAALFDPTVSANSDMIRQLPARNAVRHGIDPFFPYNHAPYEVVPFTNWPDLTWNVPGGVFTLATPPFNPMYWPRGLGNQLAPPPVGTLDWLRAEINPLGNPGFGDARWLRSFEPLRVRLDVNGDNHEEQFYTHWRHMTNIARSDNSWRVCRDISDIEGLSLPGGWGVVDNLNIPIEQWTIFTPPNADLADGDDSTGHYAIPNNFEFLWDEWFTLGGYERALQDPFNLAPTNLYCLWDLDADGVRHNFGDFPEDEFFFGSARNRVSRRLADADGDGFTDSFWFLAPSTIQSGIRTVVAITIVDNSSMLNANVASRFMANDLITLPAGGKRTMGTTPTDLALVGQLIPLTLANNYNVGFYDNPEHDNNGVGTFGYRFDYLAPDRWERHPLEVGLPSYTAPAQVNMLTQKDRLDYWLGSASKAPSDVVPSRYTPFTLSDEIELRSYSGRNTPYNYTRFEYSVQYENVLPEQSFLRSNHGDDETGEFGDLLSNRMMAMDPRHRLTLFSAARNDLMPAYLWMYSQNFDLNGDGNIDVDDDIIFSRGMQKFDLRQTYGQTIDIDFDPFAGPQVDFSEVTDAANPSRANLLWSLALRDRFKRALIEDFTNPLIPTPNAYYSDGTGTSTQAHRNQTNELATALAANVMQRRDKTIFTTPATFGIETSPLNETVPVVGLEPIGSPPSTTRMMGMEPQPFLLEAFVGHVYKGIEIPLTDSDVDPYTNGGGYVVMEVPGGGPSQARRTTVVAVQIANPFDSPIDLKDYRINVFGNSYDLHTMTENRILPPATEERPSTAIFYLVNDSFDTDQNADPAATLPNPVLGIDPALLNFGSRWRRFLSILPSDLTNTGSIAQSVSAVSATWSNDRVDYDTDNGGIELLRNDVPAAFPAAPTGQWVVLDRFDSPGESAATSFTGAVNDLGATPIDEEPVPLESPDASQQGTPYPFGVPLEPAGEELGNRFRHWVQWARVTRAWGVDVGNDGVYDQDEKSPRFVFGDKAVSTARETAPATGTFVQDVNGANDGNKYRFDNPPDQVDLAAVPNAFTGWFRRDYIGPDFNGPDPDADGTDYVVRSGKPTFFDMRSHDPNLDPLLLPTAPPARIVNFPDKGWYSQRAGGVDAPVTIPSALRLAFPFQMLHKDGEYQQLGEMLDTFCYGHKIDATEAGGVVTYTSTVKTFSEYLNDDPANIALVGDDLYVNRLRGNPATFGTPAMTSGNTLGIGVATNTDDLRHAYPDLPAAARLLDGLVCDGPGLNGVYGVDNYNLAKGFERQGTPGLVNIAGAPVEVMRSLPHWYRLVHQTGEMALMPDTFAMPLPATGPVRFNATPATAGPVQPLVQAGALVADAMMPRSKIPESILHYRERYNGKFGLGFLTGLGGGPNFEGRAGGAGISSIGELLTLNVNGELPTTPAPPGPYLIDNTNLPLDYVYDTQWRIDLGFPDTTAGGKRPFVDSVDPATRKPISLRLSTDPNAVHNPRMSITPATPTWDHLRHDDYVAGDAEEANMLFAGASNLITTRSDTFTVYFKVRSFRQNTSVTPPVWDATNKEYIVDDSRYVMLVDRSGVNKPGDKPRILYLEKLPN